MRQFKVSPALMPGARTVCAGGTCATAYLNFGRLAEVGPRREVRLDVSGEHVVAIVGKRGSGKTHTLGVLAEGLSPEAAAGPIGIPDPNRAVLILDTLNLFQWIHMPLEGASGQAAARQLDLLSQWKLAPSTIRPLYFHPSCHAAAVAESRSFTIRPRDMEAQDWARLVGVNMVSEPMGQLVADVHDKTSRTGWSTGSRHVPGRADYSIEDMIQCLRQDLDIQADYSPDTIRAVRQRLTAHDRSSLFSPQGTDLTALLSPGRTTVFLLARAPEDVRSAIVFLLIRRLLDARAAASEAAKAAILSGSAPPVAAVPPSWLVIDEAQNVLPARSASAANEVLVRFVREGRNFGLSLALSTQQPTAIDGRVMAQVDMLIAHNLTVKQDLNYVLGNLKSPEPSSTILGAQQIPLPDAIRSLEPGECFVSVLGIQRGFFAEVRPRVTIHGGFEA